MLDVALQLLQIGATLLSYALMGIICAILGCTWAIWSFLNGYTEERIERFFSRPVFELLLKWLPRFLKPLKEVVIWFFTGKAFDLVRTVIFARWFKALIIPVLLVVIGVVAALTAVCVLLPGVDLVWLLIAEGVTFLVSCFGMRSDLKRRGDGVERLISKGVGRLTGKGTAEEVEPQPEPEHVA